MSDRMMRHLEELAQKELPLRRDAMARILEQEGFSYTTQEASASYKNAQGVVNYLIETGTAPGLLFCAHYDAVAGSTGANDNAAAVCILLRLADSLRERNISARFAFFDGEEAGNAGSKLYVSSMDRTLITGVINLDMMLEQMEVTTTMHGGSRDSVEYIEPETMERMHEYLLESVTAKDEEQTTGGLFGRFMKRRENS